MCTYFVRMGRFSLTLHMIDILMHSLLKYHSYAMSTKNDPFEQNMCICQAQYNNFHLK